jgi:hypothetical protein
MNRKGRSPKNSNGGRGCLVEKGQKDGSANVIAHLRGFAVEAEKVPLCLRGQRDVGETVRVQAA